MSQRPSTGGMGMGMPGEGVAYAFGPRHAYAWAPMHPANQPSKLLERMPLHVVPCLSLHVLRAAD